MKHPMLPYPSRTRLTLAIIISLVAWIPVFAQDDIQETEPDSSAVYGDGQKNDLDYDALMKELYGSEEEKPPEDKVDVDEDDNKRKPPKERGPAPGMFKNSRLNGSYISFNGSSPYTVSGELESWYSYIDAGVAVKLPYEIWVESIPLYFIFEVSTFSFENTYPQGGTFAGLAYVFQASAIGDQSSAAVGFGVWDSEVGSMLELGYRFRPTKNTFIRVGTRGVLITDIDLIGPAWWAELRLSMGFEL